MKTSRNLVYAESVDEPTEPVMQGPFTVAQDCALEAWVEFRLYNAESNRFRDLLADSEPVDEATIRAQVEEGARRMTFVIDGVMYGTGEEVGHFCPGYYDCLRCYPD